MMQGNAKGKVVQATLATPVGLLLLVAQGENLVNIGFENIFDIPVVLKNRRDVSMTGALKQTIGQLTEYFQGKRKTFDLPLLPIGSDFQQEVWQQMSKIPYGETRSYKELATALGNSNKARAVGQAANRNPLPIVVPCHRVIGSSGRLTGFAGGLVVKDYLLRFEAER